MVSRHPAQRRCSATHAHISSHSFPSHATVVIVSALRSPITRAKKGGLAQCCPEEMLGNVFKAIIAQSKIDPALVQVSGRDTAVQVVRRCTKKREMATVDMRDGSEGLRMTVLIGWDRVVPPPPRGAAPRTRVSSYCDFCS